MKRLLLASSVALAASMVMAQNVSELAIEQQPFKVYSAFWPNLHHILWAEAWTRRPASEEKAAGSLPEPLAATLTPEERRAWDAAVSYYDREMADLHLLFEMSAIRKVLINAVGELPITGLEPEHRRVLAAAVPIYRKYWWAAHDRANRAWAKDTMEKAASLSPTVTARLARLYETPWFSRSVRVDVVRVGARQGAYTSIDPAPAHITTSSSSPTNQGWASAEILFHESSHALASPMMAAFSAEARAQGKNPKDLWHVALFYMTGEVVRQALAARGIAYEPYLYKTGLFDRAWPEFRAPIETHWKAYVNDQMSRDEAIKKIVAAIK